MSSRVGPALVRAEDRFSLHASLGTGLMMSRDQRTDPAYLFERVELLAPVLFDLDSAELSASAVAMLHEVASVLREQRLVELVEIRGYADQRGSSDHNRELSQRRAERVRTWLVEHGIAAQRLTLSSRGASDRVEAGDDAGAHEQNRRVIFRMLEEAAR